MPERISPSRRFESDAGYYRTLQSMIEQQAVLRLFAITSGQGNGVTGQVMMDDEARSMPRAASFNQTSTGDLRTDASR
jgi:hypothetical protein